MEAYMEWIFFDVFSSNQILWDPCYGVVYPTWEYIESYGTYKWHHVHIWQGVQCIHQMSLYILLSFPLTFNQQMEAYPYLGDPQRPMYSPHVSIYSSQFWSPEAYMESCMLICIFADMLQCMQICIYMLLEIKIPYIWIYGLMYGRPQRPMYSPHVSLPSSRLLCLPQYLSLWHICV